MEPARPLQLAALGVALFSLLVYLVCLWWLETKSWERNIDKAPSWIVFGTTWEAQWAVAACALALCAAACAFCEGVDLTTYAAKPMAQLKALEMKLPRFRRWRLGGGHRFMTLAMALILCRVVSLHVQMYRGSRPNHPASWGKFVGTLDLTGDGKKDTRADHLRALKSHAFQLGWDAMVPMSLLGIPTAQFSPPLRAVGLSHEAAIGFHRVLGSVTLILVSGHFGLYGLAWAMDGGAQQFWDETLQVCHHGPRVTKVPMGRAFRPGCQGISNFFGLLAWGAGILIGLGSFHAVRRRSYALFMATHQLHVAWWFFAVLHWPGALSFVAPALIFFVADAARRLLSERTIRCACTRHGPKLTTILVPCPDYTIKELTGGVFRLRSFAISLMWHPFSISGAIETPDGCAALIHVFDARDGTPGTWTHALCRLAARPFIELECRGPILAPLALQRKAARVARGQPLLLVAAGSGLAPAIAFLRLVRLANPAPKQQVRFVAIVRSAQQIEVLDAFCLPTHGAATNEAWLQTEIHITRRKTAPKLEARASMPQHGRIVVRADANANLIAVAAHWPTNVLDEAKNPLAPDEEEAKEAPRVMDKAPPGPASLEDACSILGAAFGFVFMSYVVVAREDAPFGRESPYFFDASKDGNPNTISGGLTLIVCSVTAFAGAYGSLLLCGWARRWRRVPDDVVSPADVELRVPPSPRGAEVVLATAGARPDLGEVVKRADAQLGFDAEVMAGGPDVLLGGLEDRLGGRAVKRMTWAM